MKVNTWEAKCKVCRRKVRPFTGFARHNGRRWIVRHNNCSEAWHGRVRQVVNKQRATVAHKEHLK